MLNEYLNKLFKMSRLTYLPVNWVDGMKISKNNFINTENALSDKLYLSASINLNAINYGLLPIEPGEDSSINISADLDDQQVLNIRLMRCNAVTRGGILIDIDTFKENSDSSEVFSVKESIDLRSLNNGEYYIILTVNPFKRVPVGSAHPNEKPPRSPYVIPDYTLSVVEKNTINIKDIGKYFLPIGIINIINGKPEIANNYVPPCTSVSSHNKLILFHNKLSEFWSKVEKDILEIIEKIHLKRQKSTLSSSVHIVCLKLLDFISSQMLNHRWYFVHQPPINMVAMIVQFSRLLRNTIETLPYKHKEELINYFTDWCNLRPGEFESLLHETVNGNFNQEHILQTLSEISQILEVLDKLFSKLSSLDYIGKLKQTDFFVKEEQEISLKEEQNTRSSFLAD